MPKIGQRNWACAAGGAGFVLSAGSGALCIGVSMPGPRSPAPGGHGWVGLAAVGYFLGTLRDVMLKKGNPAMGSAIPLFQESFFGDEKPYL